jgi:hypothetical protein
MSFIFIKNCEAKLRGMEVFLSFLFSLEILKNEAKIIMESV